MLGAQCMYASDVRNLSMQSDDSLLHTGLVTGNIIQGGQDFRAPCCNKHKASSRQCQSSTSVKHALPGGKLVTGTFRPNLNCWHPSVLLAILCMGHQMCRKQLTNWQISRPCVVRLSPVLLMLVPCAEQHKAVTATQTATEDTYNSAAIYG